MGNLRCSIRVTRNSGSAPGHPFRPDSKSYFAMREILHIGIDDRERNKDLLAVLRGIEDVELVSRRLEIGDFEIEGSVLIERKTAADFATSLVDGRLFSQASAPWLPATPIRWETSCFFIWVLV